MKELSEEKLTAKSQDQKEKKTILRLENVKHCLKTAGQKEDCFHVGPLSVNISQGEIIAIVGPSGSGKTTFLRLIAGLEQGLEGEITIDDVKVFGHNTFIQPEKRKVGMVFQDHALFPHLTVRKNITFGIRKLPKDDRDRKLYELEKLLHLEDCLNRYPHELSGGQQQRVALARTLAANPKIILLDEPLSNIDADLRSNLAQELRTILKETQSTAIWVTHDQDEALDLADRIVVINDGKIEQIATPWTLYNQPSTRFVASFIGDAVFLKGTLKGDTILTEIGSLDCPPCLTSCKNLEIMVRPDDISAAPHDAGIGIVSKRQFLGSIQLYSIDLPSGQQVLTTHSAHVNWPIGTKVRVNFDLKSVVAFPVE